MSKFEAITDSAKYRLKFVPEALAEWNELDGSVKEPLRKALRKRLEQPHMPGSELHGGLQHCYKIKLRKQATGWFTVWKMMRLSFWCWPSINAKI